MKYTCNIEINAPLSKVVALWEDENNFKHWQHGFQHIKHISGTPNTIGAKAEILIVQGKQTIELLETVMVNNLPEEKTALYEHVHMTNTQTSRFKALSDNKTLYISEVEYTKFNSFIPKLMAKLFPGMFKKQSEKWMQAFKLFVEQQPNE